MKQAITGATIFDGNGLISNRAVVIEQGRIQGVLPANELDASWEQRNLDGGIIAPGFIDLQVNGGGGELLNNNPTAAALKAMLAGHRQGGTTGMLPTLISDSQAQQKACVQAVAAAIADQMPGILGVHIEGPFFDMEKRGIHNRDHIRTMEQSDIDWLTSIKDFPLMLTLAPEHTQPGQIAALASAGILVCAGHTNADYEAVKRALAEGLCGFTHLFNAMSPLQGRAPGVVGAALEDTDTWCGIVADGHHVHPASIRIAHAAKPQGKLYLVTDAMATVGSSHKSFELYGEVITEQAGRLVNAEGRLAGSAISMIDAVRICATDVGLPLEETLRMASLYPAQMLSMDNRKGRIAQDYDADLVHFDEDFQVRNTWINGEHCSHTNRR
jgi:N-acetylglucosamine-6-phosphate deacetylase